MDKRTDITIISTLEDLSIYNFYKCIDGDLRYLIKGYNGEKTEVTEEIYNTWLQLREEYSKLIGGNESLTLYLLCGELIHLENMFEIVPVIVNQMTLNIKEEHFDHYIKELNHWGIPYKKGEKLSKVLTILLNKKNKYKRKLLQYEDLTKDKEKPLTLYQETAKLKRILKFDIDVKKVNVLEWLAYFDEVKLMTQKQPQEHGE